jgi:predicted  nucleic acid-binding Zn-ribbon protein
MTNDLFREGGPHNIKRSGDDEYQFSIELPTDEDGMLGRECVSSECSPGYFKVRPGTGITEGHLEAFCPYCRHSGEPREFTTKAQMEYAKSLVMREAQQGLNHMVKKALGIGPSGRKKMGGGFISMELSYKPGTPRPVPRPLEEELRRDVVCPNCGLQHAVFGLATWCPDCGMDIFLSHVAEEFKAVERVIAAVGDRRANLGARIAARDIENALEDTVSIFEAVMKAITTRHLLNSGATQDEVHEIVEKRIRNVSSRYAQPRRSLSSISGSPCLKGPTKPTSDY